MVEVDADTDAEAEAVGEAGAGPELALGRGPTPPEFDDFAGLAVLTTDIVGVGINVFVGVADDRYTVGLAEIVELGEAKEPVTATGGSCVLIGIKGRAVCVAVGAALKNVTTGTPEGTGVRVEAVEAVVVGETETLADGIFITGEITGIIVGAALLVIDDVGVKLAVDVVDGAGVLDTVALCTGDGEDVGGSRVGRAVSVVAGLGVFEGWNTLGIDGRAVNVGIIAGEPTSEVPGTLVGVRVGALTDELLGSGID